jgi:hypothetical protein
MFRHGRQLVNSPLSGESREGPIWGGGLLPAAVQTRRLLRRWPAVGGQRSACGHRLAVSGSSPRSRGSNGGCVAVEALGSKTDGRASAAEKPGSWSGRITTVSIATFGRQNRSRGRVHRVRPEVDSGFGTACTPIGGTPGGAVGGVPRGATTGGNLAGSPRMRTGGGSACRCFTSPHGEGSRRRTCRSVALTPLRTRSPLALPLGRVPTAHQFQAFGLSAVALVPLPRQISPPTSLAQANPPPQPSLSGGPLPFVATLQLSHGRGQLPGAARGGCSDPPRALSPLRVALPATRLDAHRRRERVSSVRRKPGKRSTRDALELKETREKDHPKGEALPRRGKTISGRITPQGHAH